MLTGSDAAATDSWTLERRPFALETSAPGIFAVGDVRSGSVKRVAAGVGEGGMAIAFVHQYLALHPPRGTGVMTADDRPPFDAELEPALANVPGYFTTLEPQAIPDFRSATTRHPSLDEILAGRPVELCDHVVTSQDGGEITVSVLRRTGHEGASAPGVYLMHGGGMVGGSRWSMLPMLVEWVLEYDVVAAAVEYRLAPEFPDPVPVEDCFAGFQWFLAHAVEFGFDSGHVLIGGQSAGGGLAAGTTLLARDRGGPMPAAMLLMWPMLDDRNDTVSARQVDGVGHLGSHEQRDRVDGAAR